MFDGDEIGKWKIVFVVLPCICCKSSGGIVYLAVHLRAREKICTLHGYGKICRKWLCSVFGFQSFFDCESVARCIEKST